MKKDQNETKETRKEYKKRQKKFFENASSFGIKEDFSFIKERMFKKFVSKVEKERLLNYYHTLTENNKTSLKASRGKHDFCMKDVMGNRVYVWRFDEPNGTVWAITGGKKSCVGTKYVYSGFSYGTRSKQQFFFLLAIRLKILKKSKGGDILPKAASRMI